MSSVCHYCTVRHEGCHGSGCEKWVEEAERKREEREIRSRKAAISSAIGDHKFESIMTSRKERGHRK